MLPALLTLIAGPAEAEVTVSDEHGFQVVQVVQTEAAPARAWEALTQEIDQWWSKDHSWSGDAGNFYMKVEQGGCFCEKLPGGGNAEHLRLLYYKPGEELIFDGALGPLLSMPVDGRMIWTIKATETGSRISFVYHVTGHPAANLPAIAPAVDGVIGEQLSRLASLLEST